MDLHGQLFDVRRAAAGPRTWPRSSGADRRGLVHRDQAVTTSERHPPAVDTVSGNLHRTMTLMVRAGTNPPVTVEYANTARS